MKNIKNPKRIIIFAVIILVLIIAGTAAALILSQPKSSDTSSGQDGEQTQKLERKPSEKRLTAPTSLRLRGT